MIRFRLLPIALTVAAAACSHATATPQSPTPTTSPDARANPLLKPSALLFQAPPFDRIRDADYQPALEQGMTEQLAQMNSIASQSAAPTFDNTILAMERSGALLTRAQKVFFAILAANTDETLQRVQRDEAPKLAAHSDAIFLNDKLFQRVKRIYDRRDALGLDSVQQFLVTRYYRNFVRAGAQLSETDKTRLRALNQEESTLITAFQSKLLAATKAGAVVVDDRSQLAGLSDGDIAATSQVASARGLTDKWVLPLQNTTQQPFQASLENRTLRQQLFEASTQRAEHGDSNDTRAVISRLAQLRAERAKLLGFPTYAAYSLDDQMAKTPERPSSCSATSYRRRPPRRGPKLRRCRHSSISSTGASRSRHGTGSITPSRCARPSMIWIRRSWSRTSSSTTC